MAETTYTPVAYTWELGVDWNAVPTTVNGVTTSYLSQGLVSQGAVVSPWVLNVSDTITFVVFDVTAGAVDNPQPVINTIGNLTVNSNLSCCNQTGTLNSLTPPPVTGQSYQFTQLTPFNSVVFGKLALGAWSAAPVIVTLASTPTPPPPNETYRFRFQVTFSLLIPTGLSSPTNRTYFHDPEMVVGASG